VKYRLANGTSASVGRPESNGRSTGWAGRVRNWRRIEPFAGVCQPEPDGLRCGDERDQPNAAAEAVALEWKRSPDPSHQSGRGKARHAVGVMRLFGGVTASSRVCGSSTHSPFDREYAIPAKQIPRKRRCSSAIIGPGNFPIG
jgi:hypothetical protein